METIKTETKVYFLAVASLMIILIASIENSIALLMLCIPYLVALVLFIDKLIDEPRRDEE